MSMTGATLIVLAVLLAAYGPEVTGGEHEGRSAGAAHSRQKRLLWVTNDGRLALPPGTALTITPTLSLPFVRYPPDGFLSNMSISLPFTIIFDKLGLTDNENPYGVLPPLLARSMGRGVARTAGELVADYIGSLLDHRRHGRHAREAPLPPPQKPQAANFHGGERALLYTVVEDLLDNFGMDGKACLLRAICEVQGRSMKTLGVIGELLQVFLTASKSPYADLLQEYVTAERAGRVDGECWPYFKDCPKSIFKPTERSKYSAEASSESPTVSEADPAPSDPLLVELNEGAPTMAM